MRTTRDTARRLLAGIACTGLGFSSAHLVRVRGPFNPARDPGTVSVDGKTDPSALARSETLVEDAIRAGAWTTARASEFHPLILRLSAEDRDVVMRRLFVAINAGRVAMDTAGPPF